MLISQKQCHCYKSSYYISLWTLFFTLLILCDFGFNREASLLKPPVRTTVMMSFIYLFIDNDSEISFIYMHDSFILMQAALSMVLKPEPHYSAEQHLNK